MRQGTQSPAYSRARWGTPGRQPYPVVSTKCQTAATRGPQNESCWYKDVGFDPRATLPQLLGDKLQRLALLQPPPPGGGSLRGFSYFPHGEMGPGLVPRPRPHGMAGPLSGSGQWETFQRCPGAFGRWDHRKIGTEALPSHSGNGGAAGGGALFAERGGAASGSWGARREVGVATWQAPPRHFRMAPHPFLFPNIHPSSAEWGNPACAMCLPCDLGQAPFLCPLALPVKCANPAALRGRRRVR